MKSFRFTKKTKDQNDIKDDNNDLEIRQNRTNVFLFYISLHQEIQELFLVIH